MEIHPITAAQLSQMGEVLTESAGYSVSLDEEMQYFNHLPDKSGWYFVQDSKGQVRAFVRHFKQGSDWSLGELFVKASLPNRKETAISLLQNFLSSTEFPEGHRLRFDVCQIDWALNEALVKMGFSERVQRFLHYDWAAGESGRRADTRWGGVARSPEIHDVLLVDQIPTSESQDVAEVLSHLHPVRAQEVEDWINKKAIRIVREGSKIVAAAQIYVLDDSMEVNRFATHPDYLRKGYAKKLMENILQEAKTLGMARVFLKVEDMRRPAIAFYQSMGFVEDQSKSQNWHSRWY